MMPYTSAGVNMSNASEQRTYRRMYKNWPKELKRNHKHAARNEAKRNIKKELNDIVTTSIV